PEIGDALALGSTAIGQGRLLATTAQMGSVAATIATGGRRATPVLLRDRRERPRRVLEPRVARLVGDYMTEVVRSGTGTAAALPGVQVAGKTGTAELRRSTGDPAVEGEAVVDDPTDTDAWFAAFAPHRRPRVAVAVLLVGGGTGGATAAPAARIVLQAGLQPARR
ncbi:MAG: hypothetical protein AVDCRST_MAG65-380, partial [uncultured Solirubrobacteraceae bacterium]